MIPVPVFLRRLLIDGLVDFFLFLAFCGGTPNLSRAESATEVTAELTVFGSTLVTPSFFNVLSATFSVAFATPLITADFSVFPSALLAAFWKFFWLLD